jgi:uncharacterized protein YuzE
MKITYDSSVGATYVYITKKPIAKTLEIDGYYMDFAEDGTLVGIEYLHTPIIEVDGTEVKLR